MPSLQQLALRHDLRTDERLGLVRQSNQGTLDGGNVKPFYEQPVLNSPYHPPTRHHALDDDGQPLNAEPIVGRRRSRYMVPVPKSRKHRPREQQEELGLDVEGATATYNPSVIVNEIRSYLEAWRSLPDPHDWGVTPTTQRLLQHWRKADWSNQRPFFCQLEAVETIIWLSEVARGRRQYASIFRTLEAANAEANPDLFRLAMKLATGAGKTTVMAMLIAWQSINHARQPNSSLFSKGFLIVAPASRSRTGCVSCCHRIPTTIIARASWCRPKC